MPVESSSLGTGFSQIGHGPADTAFVLGAGQGTEASAPMCLEASEGPLAALLASETCLDTGEPMVEPILRLKPGQSVRWTIAVEVLGAAADAAAIVLTLQPPAGAPDAPIVDGAPVHDGTGAYHSDQVIPPTATPGYWVRRWQATGGSASQNGIVERRFYVVPLDF